MMQLSEIVYPNINIARSINLERDHKNITILEDYQITAKATDILDRFASALQGEKVNAWSLTGPYGMGKSAFINFLMAITGSISDPVTNIAWNRLQVVAPKLHENLLKNIDETTNSNGFFKVMVTASYEPVNNSLARGLQDATSAIKSAAGNKIYTKIKKLREQAVINSRALLHLFQETLALVGKPLIIVIDEFGKNLDYMSYHHDQGDLFIVQQLVETSSIYFWVCLHQAFDEYSSGLSAMQRREWGKIQGRFEDITFIESNAQMLYLIKKTLKQNKNPAFQKLIQAWAQKTYFSTKDSNLELQNELDQKTIGGLYPFHPITATALIELCKRFAQNDRTLLAFLSSGDKYALPAYLDQVQVATNANLPTVGLDVLYDYFFNLTNTIYMSRATSHRWLEVQGIVESTGQLSKLEKSIVKTIGVFNILSGVPGLKASLSHIHRLMADTHGVDLPAVKKIISNMMQKGIIHYRDYADEYRLWEGSDFDVGGAVRRAKAELAVGDLAVLLEEYLPLPPVIAARHSYQTGTVRRFERRWLDADDLQETLNPRLGFDGLLIYSFGHDQKIKVIPEKCSDDRPLLVAYGPYETTLKELALEVASTRKVLTESAELYNDSVARKEVKYRLNRAEQQFRQGLVRLYAPGADNLAWYAKGETVNVTSNRKLSTVLSNLCDVAYKNCPRIGNEMINYDKISGATSRARRLLVEAMVTGAMEKQLGLKGHGPEVAIYRSLLLAEGLHVKDQQTGYWKFVLNNRDDKLKALWRTIEQCIEDAGEQGVVIKNIIDKIKQPPFGMKQGPSPIYISLYLLAQANEVAVFREGTYCPYSTAADMALMVKRPDLFTVKKFVSSNVQKEVFDIYKNMLSQVQFKEDPGLRNIDMLGVVGPLIKFVDDLPKYTKQTKQISPAAQRVRAAIQNSDEPVRLLFEELPQAVGLNVEMNNTGAGNWREKLQQKLRGALRELENAYPRLIENVKQTVFHVFSCDNLQEVYEKQQKRASKLAGVCDDASLGVVVNAFARPYKDPAKWLRGITGILTKKPIDSWKDDDFTIFATRLRDYVDRINQLETLALGSGVMTRRDTGVFSIMLPNGKFKRKTLQVNDNSNTKVQSMVSEIMMLPKDQAQAVLFFLAKKLLEDDASD